MKKIIVMATMAIGSFGTIEAQAQYVEKVGGSIYIDVRDMPIGTWSNGSLNSDHTETSATNMLFKRLEVAGSDEVLNLTWDLAKVACTTKGAGWRLPTLKELTLIYMLKEVLARAMANPLASTMYWSSTMKSTDNNSFWRVYMRNGGAESVIRTNITNGVRCVREVTN